MVVPLCSHMTNLCLLQGVGNRPKSTLPPSLSLFLHPSLCLSPSNTCIFNMLRLPHSCVFLCEQSCFLFLSDSLSSGCFVFLTKWHLLSLTMSLLCCFSFRDYGSKRKSGKSFVLLIWPYFKLNSPFFQFVAPGPRENITLQGICCLISAYRVMLCGLSNSSCQTVKGAVSERS